MTQMNDRRRHDAIRLLTLLVAAGAPSGAAMGSAWVLDLATQNGFDDQELLSGLNCAVEQNWLTVARTEFSLTNAGRAVSMPSRDVAA